MRKTAPGWLAVYAMAATGCAMQNTAPQPAVAPAAQSISGTILSLRPVAVNGSQEPWRTALLGDAIVAGARSDAPLTEFIVRADTGATLSIVQPNQAAFRQGDRVTILRDNRTRLLPSS